MEENDLLAVVSLPWTKMAQFSKGLAVFKRSKVSHVAPLSTYPKSVRNVS